MKWLAGNWRGWLLAIAGIVITVGVIYIFKPPILEPIAAEPPKTPRASVENPEVLLLLAAWAIIPPMWFLAEWAYWGPSRKPGQPLEEYKQSVEDFKYSQQLAKEVWLAVAVALAAIYGVKIIG